MACGTEKIMTADEIHIKLKEGLADSELSILRISQKTSVPYHRLYRLHTQNTALPLRDAVELYSYFFAKNFIKDDNDL